MIIFAINRDCYVFGDIKILFPATAKYGALFNDNLLVSFDWIELEKKNPNLDSRQAIWCYNPNGDLVWKIEAGYFIDEFGQKKELQDHIDSFAYWEKEGILVAFGRMGYRLDPETGKLGEIVYQER